MKCVLWRPLLIANIGDKEEGALAATSAASATIPVGVRKMCAVTGKEALDADAPTHAISFITPIFGKKMFVIVG